MARVLVIDDDGIMRSMLEQLLKQDAHRVKCAADGKRALKLLDKHLFDLIVTDLVMPEIEGGEMIKVIRAINKAIPIIAISGGARNDPRSDLETARCFGATRTFQKPFENSRFLAAVRECLS